MNEHYREILRGIGEDPDREGLLKTPERAAEAMAFLTAGYAENPDALIRDAVIEESSNDLVLVRSIEFHSLCEHHLLPFFGHAHVAYLPQGRIVGLSKVARLVDALARRLQVQERMTRQIAEALESALEPRGVAVVVEARHLCMTMRGVQKHDALMVTSHLSGVFRDDAKSLAEFYSLIGR
ncbi:MAG TPA: GTP cyclohydrolase I FolE [Armatimonadota bacterium]